MLRSPALGSEQAELGIDVWCFGGGVESMAGVESVASVSMVGLIYGFVSAGVGLVYGFRLWPWVLDRVSSCGFPVGVGRGFDYGGIWFEI